MAARAGTMAIAGGVLLLASGATSSTLLFDQIGSFVQDRFPDAGDVVETVLKVLAFLASFGGLVVIVGGALMVIGREKAGRLVVLVAAVMALVGLVLQVIILVDQGEGSAGWWLDIVLVLNLVGVGLAFFARP